MKVHLVQHDIFWPGRGVGGCCVHCIAKYEI